MQVRQQGIGEAGIEQAVVRLPKSLALDPDNAQALCEFADGTKPDLENHCPKGSIVGRARAVIPLLNDPLVGNVYFVKNIRIDKKTGNEIRTLPMIQDRWRPPSRTCCGRITAATGAKRRPSSPRSWACRRGAVSRNLAETASVAHSKCLRRNASTMILQGHGPAITLEVNEDRAILRHGGEPVRSWPVVAVDSLSTYGAARIAVDGELLVSECASPKALVLLREAGISYVTRDGEWHLLDPPGVFVVKPADRKTPLPDPSPERPLGMGAARIARWLLLHPGDEPPAITELARVAGVSEATSSRGVRHLAERPTRSS